MGCLSSLTPTLEHKPPESKILNFSLAKLPLVPTGIIAEWVLKGSSQEGLLLCLRPRPRAGALTNGPTLSFWVVESAEDTRLTLTAFHFASFQPNFGVNHERLPPCLEMLLV